jgi:hypothetical protein
MDRASEKSNPSFCLVPENQKYQKTRKPEPIPEVPVQISTSSVSRVKFGFSEI